MSSGERLDLGINAGSQGAMAVRWRREDYHVVKHDNCFSDWKVLVSGADWKEQRERGGEQRFRSSNLPSPYVGAGVYELGVILPVWKTSDCGSSTTTTTSTLKSDDILVVYVGCADRIRQRLLRYCQAGAHVESPRSPTTSSNASAVSRTEQWNVRTSPGSSRQLSPQASPKRLSSAEELRRQKGRSNSDIARMSRRLEKQLSIDKRAGSLSPIAERDGHRSGSPRGPRLFSEVFALGCSIAFRWASTKSKDDAEFVMTELTGAFDYAWSRGGGRETRSQDILQKIVLGRRGRHDWGRGLDYYNNNFSPSRWRFLFRMKEPAGVKVAAHKPAPEPQTRWRERRSSSTSSDWARSAGSLCIMLPRSRPRRSITGGSSKSSKHSEFTKIDIPVDRCGELLENGLVCNALPQKGRKRCHMHFDARKPPRKKTSQVASSQDSRNGSLASDGTASVDSLRFGSLGLQSTPSRPSSSSCFPRLATKKPKLPQTTEPPRKRGSVSFSTWLGRSELLKAKSLEWLLAMEEIKGRGNHNNTNITNTTDITNITNINDIDTNDSNTSPILKPDLDLSPVMNPVSEPEYETPVKAGRISLNLNQGMDSHAEHEYQYVSRSPVRWSPSPMRQTYATSYNPPQFPRLSFS